MTHRSTCPTDLRASMYEAVAMLRPIHWDVAYHDGPPPSVLRVPRFDSRFDRLVFSPDASADSLPALRANDLGDAEGRPCLLLPEVPQ